MSPESQSADEVAPERRAGGRPLDQEVDAAILRAATKLLHAEGFARMSIAGVADAAGVGRPAIYRRYRDKSDLALAVIENMQRGANAPDTGSTRQDLVAHLEFARRKFDTSLAGTLLVEEGEHPELLQQFRKRMIRPRFGLVTEALERGKERGEVREDLDVDLAAQALLGSFLQHYMTKGRPGRGWAEQVVATLWPAFKR
jgi:AcrR family transcriptional regulator